MTIRQIIHSYITSQEQKERKAGRYHASELGDIISGKLKPKDFFKPKKIDEEGAWNIFFGVVLEEGLRNVFEQQEVKCEFQAKKEIKIDDFVIVCKADFKFSDRIIEMKAPLREKNEISSYHIAQAEAYFRAWGLPVYLMYFMRNGYRQFLYKTNQSYWDFIVKEVKKFDKKLKEL